MDRKVLKVKIENVSKGKSSSMPRSTISKPVSKSTVTKKTTKGSTTTNGSKPQPFAHQFNGIEDKLKESSETVKKMGNLYADLE
jgi:hypothetical protein